MEKSNEVVCCKCGKKFVPALKPLEQGEKRSAEDVYPHATPEEIAQIELQICSFECMFKE